ncbi:prepilin peptidase [Leuconostoc litchii]|uniref:Prepilin peptidase n=1 Tax=Leuconostoc litchii TaxID=1981069 RepID=A0A6P2CSG5_9LACO|nr:prepilin peptidase [Leuconostoc litchii]TYC47711.1 prepilin peptidase [Leuconostoc litchii]
MEYIFIFAINSVVVSTTICIAERLSHNISLWQKQSFCFQCRHPLVWIDMIPIFSVLVYHHRCRYCHADYGIRYVYLEIICTIIGLFFWSVPVLWLTYIILILLSLEDYLTQKIHAIILYPWLVCLITIYHDIPHLCLSISMLTLCLILVHYRHTLGDGDIPVLLVLILTSKLLSFAYILLTSCFLALTYLLFLKQKRLPFVPFLHASWIIVNLYELLYLQNF